MTGPIRLHHPGVVVPDLERAVEFYSAFLGLTVEYDEAWDVGNDTYDQGVGLHKSAARGKQLRGANFFLELWQYDAPEQIGRAPSELGANDLGLRHLAFEVDDVAAQLERLVELGGSKMNDPVQFDDDDLGSVTYCRDPFGNIIELTTAGPFPASVDTL